ncbi:MAG: DUF349 domain-containing protein [Reichenbachiella sp.]
MDIPYGFIENNYLHRDAIGEIPPLKLQEIQEDHELKIVEKFVANFEKLKSKLEKILSKIDGSDNKGSFLSGLLNLKTSITSYEGLGDYQLLLEKIEVYEAMLQEYVSKNRQKNTEIKQALLLELDTILENNDMIEAFELIKDLKIRWVKTGSAEGSISEEVENKFKLGLDQFFEKRKSFLEAKNLLKSARVEDYQNIIDQIEGFVKSKKFLSSVDKVKDLQKQWKETGTIPSEDFKKLNGSYWKVCQQYFEELRKARSVSKKSKSFDEKSVLKERESILERMKKLADRRLENVQGDLNTLKGQWKSAGSLPKSKFSAMQEEFLAFADVVNEQNFVLQLATRKNKGFANKSEKEKIQLSIQVLKNLLRRDKEELSSFSENMGNMHINKGTFVDMLESKLKVQERKVERKVKMLKDYQTQLEILKT